MLEITKRKPILITLLFALVMAGVFSVILVTDMNENTKDILVESDDSIKTSQVSMIIEDNNYVMGGLIPPDHAFLDFGDGLDLEDDLGKKSRFYEGLENLFVDYDNIIIIDHDREPDQGYTQPTFTYIFMTKEPFEYETSVGEFFYKMLGIRLIIQPKGDYTQERYIGEGKDKDSEFITISDDGFTGKGREKFRAQDPDGVWFDLTTSLAFVDNEHSVSIRGLITMDQAVELAKVIRR